MKVTEVHFNHDSSGHSGDALNIRGDETAGSRITAPEWREGQTPKPAAYAAALLGATITVKARFAQGTPDSSVTIRAVDTQISPPGPGGCAGVILRILRALARAISGNVLGEPQARSVAFDSAGISELAEFTLVGHTVKTRPVGINTTSWRWEAQIGGSWVDIGTTQHKIYVLLDTPGAPWQQAPYTDANLQLPWARALEYSCSWAFAAFNAIDATGKITERINGHPLQSYTPATMFGWTSYRLSDYLDSLEGGIAFQLNCTDCADAVTTLANVVGCRQAEGRMFSLVTRKFLTLGG